MKTNQSPVSLSSVQCDHIARNCRGEEAEVWYRGEERMSKREESNMSLNGGGICLRILADLVNFGVGFNWFGLFHCLCGDASC